MRAVVASLFLGARARARFAWLVQRPPRGKRRRIGEEERGGGAPYEYFTRQQVTSTTRERPCGKSQTLLVSAPQVTNTTRERAAPPTARARSSWSRDGLLPGVVRARV